MFFKYLFSQLRLYMSDSQQFADITAKLLNIFSFMADMDLLYEYR